MKRIRVDEDLISYVMESLGPAYEQTSEEGADAIRAVEAMLKLHQGWDIRIDYDEAPDLDEETLSVSDVWWLVNCYRNQSEELRAIRAAVKAWIDSGDAGAAPEAVTQALDQITAPHDSWESLPRVLRQVADYVEKMFLGVHEEAAGIATVMDTEVRALRAECLRRFGR